MPAYRYSREEVLAKLRAGCSRDGTVTVDIVSLWLLDVPVTDTDIAWAYQRARQHGWMDSATPTDPRTTRQLSLDT